MTDTDKLNEEIAELSRQIRRDDIVMRIIAYVLGALIVVYAIVLVLSMAWG